jgi:hypothetical protein
MRTYISKVPVLLQSMGLLNISHETTPLSPALSGKERVKGWAAVGVGGGGAGDDPLQLAEA